MMKFIKYLGLVMLVVGALLTFVMAIWDVAAIEKYERYIDIMWPFGLLLYYLMEMMIKKENSKTA